MISAIEGTVELRGERFLILNTGSLFYRVFASAETLRKISEKGQKINPSASSGQAPSTPLRAGPEPSRRVKLWTHLCQREDTQELYGFLHFAELEFFEMLIQIPGIGPKSGLGIMGVAPLDTLKKAIAAGDTSYLTKVSGIGRKTAEKVILELREKLSGKGVIAVDAPELKEEADALDALMTLGYTQSEAREALSGVSKDIRGASARVREALRQLGRNEVRK